MSETREKTVREIPVKAKVNVGAKSEEKPKLKVAAYCRVSTDSDEQATSYEAQIEHYKTTIEANPAWRLAGIYADAADIIGLNQKPEANGRRFSPFSLVSAHFKANGGCNCLI